MSSVLFSGEEPEVAYGRDDTFPDINLAIGKIESSSSTTHVPTVLVFKAVSPLGTATTSTLTDPYNLLAYYTSTTPKK